MKEKEKIIKARELLDVKKLIAQAKEKKIIKPLKEAFKSNPVEKECHKGKADYYLN